MQKMYYHDLTIGIVNYQGQRTLSGVIDAIRNLRHPVRDIIVVDNCSTDGSREWLKDNCSDIRGIWLDKNIGPSDARNVILRESTTEYVLIIDNDIVIEPDAVDFLMEIGAQEKRLGVCHPEIKDPNDPMVHHYNGGWIHFLGTFISRPNASSNSNRPNCEMFPVVSGAAMLMRRETANYIGGFDEDYFFNWEDGDFTARLTLAGYRCFNIPKAIVHHQAKARGKSKVFYQVRNRWYFILKLYSSRTIALISPLLVLFELLQALVLFRKGVLYEYWKGSLSAIYGFQKILEKRRAFRKIRLKRDCELLKSGEMFIPESLEGGRFSPFIHKSFFLFCNAYWSLVKHFC